MKKNKYLIAGITVLLLAFVLILTGCDELFGTDNDTTYTYYFVNYSSYQVTVNVGGVSGTIPIDDYRYINLQTSVTTFTYSPANLVTYTGGLLGTVTFFDK
jgi:hypothetical protein